VLLTQTRWDENDLAGMILSKQKELGLNEWEILLLPAIKDSNDNDEDPRNIGEALWENKHSSERLLAIQKQSIRTFQSLYQQNPKPTQAGGEFYKMFKVSGNVRKTEYNPNIALHLTFDFNVRPAMHASAWQILTLKTEEEILRFTKSMGVELSRIPTELKVAMKVREFITKSPANNTKGICNEFKRWKPTHVSGLSIYGDPSGNNEDTRTDAGWNDFRIIQNELSAYKPQMRVSKSHPSVAGRGDFINSVFDGGIPSLLFIIGDNCPKSIEDYQYIKEDSDRTKLKSKVTDPDTGKQHEKYGHLSDGDDYFFCSAFAMEFAKYQAGDVVGSIAYSKNIPSKNSY
jgi:hypothetical protein